MLRIRNRKKERMNRMEKKRVITGTLLFSSCMMLILLVGTSLAMTPRTANMVKTYSNDLNIAAGDYYSTTVSTTNGVNVVVKCEGTHLGSEIYNLLLLTPTEFSKFQASNPFTALENQTAHSTGFYRDITSDGSVLYIVVNNTGNAFTLHAYLTVVQFTNDEKDDTTQTSSTFTMGYQGIDIQPCKIPANLVSISIDFSGMVNGTGLYFMPLSQLDSFLDGSYSPEPTKSCCIISGRSSLENPTPKWTENTVYVFVFFPGNSVMWEGGSGSYSTTFNYGNPSSGIGIDQSALLSCCILLGIIVIWRRKLIQHK